MSTLFIFPPTKIDKTGLATEDAQQAQLTELQDINTELDTQTVVLNDVSGYLANIDITSTDTLTILNDSYNLLTTVESDLVAIAGYVDQLEAGQVTSQGTLSSIDTSLNSIEADTLAQKLKSASALVTSPFDYISLSYVGVTTKILTVVYKIGGAAGTTVATLTLGYDGSDRLTSVTRS